MAEHARLICRSDELPESGKGIRFQVERYGRPVPAFVVRYAGQVYAYINECKHVPVEMDWQPGQFWNMDKRFIICSIHGALYDPSRGGCVQGPCRGARLIGIPLTEEDGQVYWYPSERFQPVL